MNVVQHCFCGFVILTWSSGTYNYKWYFGDHFVLGNVLLLRNNLNLSADVAEVSQEKLLSLVAERLIDSNSNVNNKDVGYIENQQQNISDAIDLLPRLTTGIDVNLKFTRISDFEFTRECAIFDLLDIPLYHGWIVDPQACSLNLCMSYRDGKKARARRYTRNPKHMGRVYPKARRVWAGYGIKNIKKVRVRPYGYRYGI
ncbi:putative MINDY deubiquitinase [Helianthus annuus]|nr:putative MINDY deubiquitinase [Helianthus annuus]